VASLREERIGRFNPAPALHRHEASLLYTNRKTLIFTKDFDNCHLDASTTIRTASLRRLRYFTPKAARVSSVEILGNVNIKDV
jgi:hypothetical protein